MTEAEFEKRAEKYSEYVERFARGVVGAENVKVGMIQAYKDGYDQGKADCLIEGKTADDCIRCAKDLIKVQKENEAFVANLKESVEIQEKTVESLTDKIARLLQLVEQLKKSAIVWHKIIYQDDPDNTDRCLVANSPAEEDKEYLLKTKYGFAIDKLDYDETGFFFQDYDWDSIEAWAELPEVGK